MIKTKLEDIKAATVALAEKGLIYDSGERRNGQIVWKVTPDNVIAFPSRKRPTAPRKRPIARSRIRGRPQHEIDELNKQAEAWWREPLPWFDDDDDKGPSAA